MKFACSKCEWKILNQVVYIFMKLLYFFNISGTAAQRGLWPPRHTSFLDHTACRRDLYLKKTQQTPPVGFEPRITVGERP
jgi:hypothetical protein